MMDGLQEENTTLSVLSDTYWMRGISNMAVKTQEHILSHSTASNMASNTPQGHSGHRQLYKKSSISIIKTMEVINP